MCETYTSERLLRELPRPLINFIWYLWDTYADQKDSEFRITLQNDDDGNQQIILQSGVAVTQNFDCAIGADIVIRRVGERCFMEYY